MSKRVLVYGSADWAPTLTRPVTFAFYDLWPATHVLYIDVSGAAGQIAISHADRCGYKAYVLERRHLNAEFDVAYGFLWDNDPDMFLGRARVRKLYLTTKREPNVQPDVGFA